MHHIKIFGLFICVFITQNLSAQTDNGNYREYTKYQMDYISNGELPNFRIRKKGDKALSLYYFVPFDWSAVNEDIISDSNTIVDNKHRVTEKLVPNYRYYLSDRSNLTFGIYYKRTNVKYAGEIDQTVTPSPIESEKEQFIQNGIYGRIGFDRHLAQPSFKLFDLDFYVGSALSFGFAPSNSLNETNFENGDFNIVRTKSNTIGLGLDLYGGLNFQFDNFSIGLELIALGFDSNKGVGKTKVKSQSSIGGTTSSEEYFTYDDNPGIAYSKLNLSRNMTSMYRGVRFSVAYYFK
jgi:hypothetical protein